MLTPGRWRKEDLKFKITFACGRSSRLDWDTEDLLLPLKNITNEKQWTNVKMQCEKILTNYKF